MQKTLLDIVSTVNGYLSDYILIFLLVGVGIFFTVKTRFVQVRCFGEGMKRVFGGIKLRGGKNSSGISSFQALATAIAAQVGTGNIVGASGAILVGGPGAIFWMWVIAFLGMATIYAEAVLAQKTRTVDENGNVHGGPVYYIKEAFKGTFGKILAVFFAIATMLALGFMGAMVQSNSIAEAICNAADTDYTQWGWIIGIVLAVVCAIIFIGGISRIASVAEKIVPIMACLFLLGGLIVLITNITRVPETFGMIFKYAFAPQALIGGGIGYALKTAVSQGAKRGLFSNEAGMGSTPHAHAVANVEKPHDQGVVAMVGVFIDTFVVLTMTALVVITVLFTEGGPLYNLSGDLYVAATTSDLPGALSKTNAMQMAVTNGFPEFMSGIGEYFVAVCLLFFAFTTIIGWNFFAKVNAQYLFKTKKVFTICLSKKKNRKITVSVEKLLISVFSVLSIVFIFLGSTLQNDLVWELTDFFNYLMVLPNAIALIALSKFVKESSLITKKKKK